MAKIAISLPDELVEQVNDQLEYGDNRSEWIREAIKLRFEVAKENDEGNAHKMGEIAAD